MCLKIVPKSDLAEEQLRYIAERISAPEHVDDAGPPSVWNTYPYGLYAVIRRDSNMPVGIIEASGPLNSVVPGWWLDSVFRGKGLGNKMVDALAGYLKELGYSGVGNICVQTRNQDYDEASSALAKRFRKHFDA
jgi:RimJ/RimL family protein N-acetyltransferase